MGRELLNLLAIEEKLIIIDKTLQQLLKDHSSSFGGTYINVTKNQVFVNTVNPSVVPIIKSSSELTNNDYLNFVTFVTASNSMDILAYRIIKIYEKIKQFKPINILCYIDMELNNVVVRHDQKTNDGDLNLKIFSGEGLINLFNNLGCSVGFWARDKKDENQNYIVTAGHCSNKLSRLVGSKYLKSMTTLIRNTDSEEHTELIIERGIQTVSHGAHVCKAGFSSHVTCGYIKGLITISTFLEGIPFKDYIFYGKDAFQISCGGDSG
ncbi:11065_t:CDS:2, partial [Dentiscutata heterogama]